MTVDDLTADGLSRFYDRTPEEEDEGRRGCACGHPLSEHVPNVGCLEVVGETERWDVFCACENYEPLAHGSGPQQPAGGEDER